MHLKTSVELIEVLKMPHSEAVKISQKPSKPFTALECSEKLKYSKLLKNSKNFKCHEKLKNLQEL